MSVVPVRLAEALADRYRLERELGAGGMATVYLAEDLKHKRRVAVKVLKPELAAVLGAERFVQEITTTASLQHPHILPLFDSGTADGFLYYVMPFIDGETLRGKLDRETQLGIDEAVRVATDVASALHYAHQHGVIHRDIKPENMLLHDGRPMVADFGIALAVSAAAGGRMTETGLSLGTPHYMSPEQATAEKEITARSDVYSLGSVLYEMLTGNPPHMGSSAQQIIMKIIAEDAQAVTKLRKSVPRNVAAAVAKSLEKLPADRFESAKAFAEALANPGFTVGRSTSAQAAADVPPRWNWLSLTLAAVAAILLVTTLWGWRDRTPPLSATRAVLDLGEIEVAPPGQLLVSRDGSRFAIVGTQDGRIYWRPATEEEFRPIPGTEDAAHAAFSPDGLELAFALRVGRGPMLLRVALDGGAPQTVASPGGSLGGLDWGDGDAIVFTSWLGQGLYRVPAGGGTVDTILGEGMRIGNLSVLPGGGQVLFAGDSGGVFSTQLVDVGSGTRRLVRAGALNAQYVEPGYLVYADERGTLWGARFDLGKGDIVGEPFSVLDGVTVYPERGGARLAVSQTGTLLFGAGGVMRNAVESDQLVEAAMNGSSRVLPLPPRRIGFLAVSPNNRTVAFISRTGTDPELYTYDTELGTSPRLLDTDGIPTRPVWSPTGTRLAIPLAKLSPVRRWVVIKDMAGDAPDRILHSSMGLTGDAGRPAAWPTEDTLLLARGGLARQSLWHLVLLPDTAVASEYLQTDGGLATPKVSRQRDLVVYQESGVIWARDYPKPSPPTRISVDGGSDPRWAPDGRTVYYWARSGEEGDWKLLAARLRRSPSLAVTRTDTIYTAPAFTAWDLYPDGERFLVAQPLAPTAPATAARREPFSVMTNFAQELKRRAPR
jgi:serine/threonine-protein kinase